MSPDSPHAASEPDLRRVLHISGRSDHGGGPEHVLQVVSADLRAVTHHVACPDSGLYWERFRQRVGGERMSVIPHRRLSPAALWQLRTFILRRRIQVIHSHGMSGGIYGRCLGLLTGLPVIHSFHGVPVTPGLKHRFYQHAEQILARFTQVAVAVSAGEADLVHKRWRCYRGRLAVVPNGIDLGAACPGWSPWPTSEELRVVSFSRRNSQKHPELLIEVARCLHLLGIRYRIDAFGEGLDHPSLTDEARRRGIGEHLHFRPPTDAPSQAIAGAHIYLSTSRWEGMPLAILEAWRAGLVVVASDVVGNRDLVADGETGLLYPAGSGRQAARLIRTLAGDPVTADQLRHRAAARASLSYGRDLMAMRLEWLYHRMCHNAQRTKPITVNAWPEELAEAQARPLKTPF